EGGDAEGKGGVDGAERDVSEADRGAVRREVTRMSKRLDYPFVPKSTAYLEPGHFWSIPMRSGRFACGRVIQLRIENGKRDSRMFLAGLMDWTGNLPPTSDAIAGCGVNSQGAAHVKTIGENNGEVLGFRDLCADGIEPWMFLDAHSATRVQHGFNELR